MVTENLTPGRTNFDLSLAKDTPLHGERLRFKATVDAFNIFNHTEFRNLGNNSSSSKLGEVLRTYDPRILQLGAHNFLSITTSGIFDAVLRFIKSGSGARRSALLPSAVVYNVAVGSDHFMPLGIPGDCGGSLQEVPARRD